MIVLGRGLFLLLAAALLLRSGITLAEDRRLALPWQGAERSYLLHVPDGAGAAALPLVVALHGAGGDGASFAAETQFAPAADGPVKMLVAFPDGTQSAPGRGTWNAHFCCGVSASSGTDDVGFIGALIEDIAGHHAVDRAQIYATGMSNGGMLSYQLAAAHPEWFAAIAPVSATIGGTARSGASFLIDVPRLPVPVMILHGRLDRYVMFDGGASPMLSFPNRWKMSVADALSFWSAADGCPTAALTDEPVPGKLRRVAYRGCAGGSDILLWEIEDGGHAWPGDAPFPAGAGGSRSAASEILSFFAAHQRK